MGTVLANFPDQIIIRGECWGIQRIRGLKDDDDGTELLGRCQAHSRVIQLEEDQTDNSAVGILLHEIAHAYQFLTPIPGLPKGYHETLCDHFSSHLSDLVRSNDLSWVRFYDR